MNTNMAPAYSLPAAGDSARANARLTFIIKSFIWDAIKADRLSHDAYN